MSHLRGREVSRIEGFSDAVFGFALTLLVVSLEVPDNIDGLKQILRGFIPFAATFALMCWIWFEHYAFFRKFDAEDPASIFLNCVLLFLVLFFVYPLKFVFALVIPALTRLGPPISMSAQDGRLMMWVYSAGFVAMMLIFVLLYWNQYRRRTAFGLSDEQAFAARTGARTHLLSVGVGAGIDRDGADGPDRVDLDRRRHLRNTGAVALAQRRADRACTQVSAQSD